MDIQLLSTMVGELLLSHNEVGLPGLGSFVAELVPASFADRGYTINPPYRRVSFMPGRSDDDSLVKLYAESNGIDFDQAKSILQHFLEETKKELMERKTVVFPGLGRLRATKQNNIFFISDENLDIYPDGFGLPSVSLKNHSETQEEVHHVVTELASIVGSPAAETAQSTEAEPVELISEEELQKAVQPITVVEPEPEPEPKEPYETPVALRETYETPVSERKREAYESPESERRREVYAAPSSVRKREAYDAPVSVRKREEYEAPVSDRKREAYIAPFSKRKREKYRRPRTYRKISKWWWLGPLIAIGVLALALAIFLILCQVAPDFIDSLLYTPEELRIINY